MEAMRLLEEVEDRRKLEVWMVIVWLFAQVGIRTFESIEDAERVTLESLLRRLLALPRFGELCGMNTLPTAHKVRLRRIYDQA